MDWNEWLGKRIFVKLLSGGVYSGKVLEVEEPLIKIKDKFGEIVLFRVDDISKIKGEGGNDN